MMMKVPGISGSTINMMSANPEWTSSPMDCANVDKHFECMPN